MTDEPTDTVATPQADGLVDGVNATDANEGVRATFARLLEDGRAYATAEADRQKVRAAIVFAGVRNAAILGIIAVILAFSAIVALLVGLIFTLAQLIAPIWATLIVVGVALTLVVALLLSAKACIGRMKKAISA